MCVGHPKSIHSDIFYKACLHSHCTHLPNEYILLRCFKHLKSKQKRFENHHKGLRGVSCGVVLHAPLCRQPSTPSPTSETTQSIKCYAMIHALSCFTVVRRVRLGLSKLVIKLWKCCIIFHSLLKICFGKMTFTIWAQVLCFLCCCYCCCFKHRL